MSLETYLKGKYLYCKHHQKVYESIIESCPKLRTLYFVPYLLSFCHHSALKLQMPQFLLRILPSFMGNDMNVREEEKFKGKIALLLSVNLYALS